MIYPFYICGPTASGKSALALEMARKLDGEIVNADAFQLYRGLEIVSAAPSADELTQVPHHLYGVLEPTESADAQRYVDLAKPVIAEIQSRGKTPIITGGSGLYLKFLTHGAAPLPTADATLRAEMDARPLEDLVAQLQQLDPVEAARTALQNRRFVSRALEICMLSGQKASDLRDGWEKQTAEISSQLRGIVIQRTRPDLHARIARRTRAMLDGGAFEEVAALTGRFHQLRESHRLPRDPRVASRRDRPRHLRGTHQRRHPPVCETPGNLVPPGEVAASEGRSGLRIGHRLDFRKPPLSTPANQEPMPTQQRVFISYRRKEPVAAGFVYRFAERLEAHFGKGHVFLDANALPYGRDFREALLEELDRADILFVIIGPGWVERLHELIDEPKDYVRIEVEHALTSKRAPRVIPILVGGVAMPRSSDLPEPVRNLANMQGTSIDTQRLFHETCERLLQDLSKSSKPKAGTEPVPDDRGGPGGSLRRRMGFRAFQTANSRCRNQTFNRHQTGFSVNSIADPIAANRSRSSRRRPPGPFLYLKIYPSSWSGWSPGGF